VYNTNSGDFQKKSLSTIPPENPAWLNASPHRVVDEDKPQTINAEYL
jgi:hypothetical protein